MRSEDNSAQGRREAALAALKHVQVVVFQESIICISHLQIEFLSEKDVT